MELYLALITFTYIYKLVVGLSKFLFCKRVHVYVFFGNSNIDLLYCWNVKPSYHAIHSVTTEIYCTWTKRSYKYDSYWVESGYKLCFSVCLCVRISQGTKYFFWLNNNNTEKYNGFTSTAYTFSKSALYAITTMMSYMYYLFIYDFDSWGCA